MLKSGAKSLLCRNMYNKKDAADLAASFLSFVSAAPTCPEKAELN